MRTSVNGSQLEWTTGTPALHLVGSLCAHLNRCRNRLVKPFDRDRLRTAILRCLQEMADEHLGEASAGEGKDRTNEGA